MAHSKNKIATLRQNFEKAVEGYLTAFLKQMEWDSYYGYWVADDVTGIYAYGDEMFISLADIIYCVDNNVQEKELIEWQDYNVWAGGMGQSHINLYSWHKGYRGIPKEARNKMDSIKKELDDLIKENKTKY